MPSFSCFDPVDWPSVRAGLLVATGTATGMWALILAALVRWLG